MPRRRVKSVAVPRFIFLHSLIDLTTGHAKAVQTAWISVIAMHVWVFSFRISYRVKKEVGVYAVAW